MKLVPVVVSIFLAFNIAACNSTEDKKKHIPRKDLVATLFLGGDVADCRRVPVESSAAMKTAELIQDLAKQERDYFVVTLGDNTYPVGKLEEFEQCYHPSWGRFKEKTLPSPGNHDYGIPKAMGYYTYFGELAGPDRRGYYVKKLKNWTLYSLNSNLDAEGMQKQIEWLTQQLKDQKGKCSLAFWHHPVFSSGGHGNNEKMAAVWKILANAKTDLIFTSHDHDYERFKPMNADGEVDENGVTSFVVGTAGAQLTPMFLPKASTVIRDNSSHGVLRLRLYSSSYEWEFMPIPGKKFTDKGYAACH